MNFDYSELYESAFLNNDILYILEFKDNKGVVYLLYVYKNSHKCDDYSAEEEIPFFYFGNHVVSGIIKEEDVKKAKLPQEISWENYIKIDRTNMKNILDKKEAKDNCNLNEHIELHKNKFSQTNKGWECPKCGRIYSPIMTGCPNCNNKINNNDDC